MVSMCSRSLLTHRCVYRLLVEEITNELDVHHVCGQPACLNPRHLIALTPEQHSRAHSGRALAWVAFVGAMTPDRFEPLDVFEQEYIGLPFKPMVLDIDGSLSCVRAEVSR